MSNSNQKLGLVISRVSTHDQEDKYSLGAQTKLILEYAEKENIRIVKKYVFAESASEADSRKIFKEILDYLFSHCNVHYLLVEKPDRLHRNFEDFNNVDRWLNKDADNKVVFVKRGLIVHKNSLAHEKFQWAIDTVLANHNSNNMGDEISKGMKEKAEGGEFPTKVPLGYLNHQEFVNGNDIRTIIIDPVRFPLIEKAFKYYASGNYTLKTLSQKMYDEGLKTKKTEKKLSTTTMACLLHNEFYIGNFTWNGKKYYNGKHSHAVSRELFDLVKIQLGTKSAGKFRKHAFTYKGLIRCGECGYAVTGTIEKKYVYYGCNHYKPCFQKRYIREEAITEQISDMLDCLKIPDVILEALTEQLKQDHQSEMSVQNKVVGDLERRLTVLRNRKDVIYDDKLDGLISLEVFENKNQRVDEEIEKTLELLAKHNGKSTDYAKTGSIILELASKAKTIFLHRTSDEKRLLLSFVISKIFFKDGKLEFQLKKPFDIIFDRAKSKKMWT